MQSERGRQRRGRTSCCTSIFCLLIVSMGQSLGSQFEPVGPPRSAQGSQIYVMGFSNAARACSRELARKRRERLLRDEQPHVRLAVRHALRLALPPAEPPLSASTS